MVPQASVSQVEAEAALRRWGRGALSFDVFLGPERYDYFASKEVPGALVAFERFGQVEVVMGDVIAPEDGVQAVYREYFGDRIAKRRPVLGFSVPQSFAEAAVEVGAAAAQWTAEPELDPLNYSPTGKHAKKLRSYVKKLRAQGVEGVAVPMRESGPEPSFAGAAERLISDWLAHGPPRGSHLLEVNPWIHASEKRFFAVPNPNEPGKLWSLLIAHPIWARAGWHFAHLIHDHEAPRGVNELAVLTAIEAVAGDGCRYATFGPFASPQAGPFLGFGRIWHPILRRVYNSVAKSSGYTHTLEFYDKIQAHPWADRYMAVTPKHFPLRPLRALLDLTHALGTHGRHPIIGHTPSGEHAASSEAPGSS